VTPPPGVVQLWWLPAEHAGPAALACLTPAERARAQRLPAAAGARFAAARAALRRILGALTGVPARAMPLRTDARGRPYLPGGPAFSLSHSAGRVLCAVARGRVGVDLEAQRAVSGAVALGGELFGADFGARLAGLPAPARDAVFLAAWTRAEAVLKAAGTGWAGAAHACGLGSVSSPVRHGGRAYHVQTLELPRGWHGALAADFAVRTIIWSTRLASARRPAAHKEVAA
jgi:4'-phosphopantetheinyl transferase